MARLIRSWEDGNIYLKCSHCGYRFLLNENWRQFHYCYNCGESLDE